MQKLHGLPLLSSRQFSGDPCPDQQTNELAQQEVIGEKRPHPYSSFQNLPRLTANRENATDHTKRGNHLFRARDFDGALSAFDEAIKMYPESATTHSNRGMTLSKLNRSADALTAHEQAIALNPQAAHAHAARGMILRESNRFKEGLEALNKAIALDSQNVFFHEARVKTLRGLRQYDETSLQAVNEAIMLMPNDPKLYQYKADIHAAVSDVAQKKVEVLRGKQDDQNTKQLGLILNT